jgi:hypothetical protein
MAQRGEGQGLQIAVISFAMLTLILAITTYVFYAQSATSQKDLAVKAKSLSDMQANNNKLLYRVTAMQYTLGQKGVTKEQVDVAKGQAGGDDAEVKDLLDNFAADNALVGEQIATEGPRNYRTINSLLLAALNKKNASVAESQELAKKIQLDRDAAEAAAKSRAETAEKQLADAAKIYSEESAKFAADRTQGEEEKAKLVTQTTAVASKAKSEMQKVIEEKDQVFKNNAQLTAANKIFLERLEQDKKGKTDLFEHPDGYVKHVNQRQRLVWIDVGRADGLLRQTTFTIHDHDENGVSNSKPKGRIEIVSIDDHMAEARILEDSPANPIIPGDIIHTPAWSPGQRVHFALAMKMDVNKDRIDDYDLVKSIIQLNGGVIDAELRADGTREGNISVSTRYFVEGEKPSDVTSSELMKKYVAFDEERERFSVQKIPLDRLLALMGWKAEERTVELAGNRGGEFRKRSPGKTQPASAATPAAETTAPPTTSEAPAATGADPFGTAPPVGGSSPIGGAAPAAPVVDPFAPPGGVVDPFAPPR